MTVVLKTRGLRKTYGKVVALAGLDLDVNKGEVFGFLGPNGAGKTTFTKCVTGFVRPDAGTVEIAGIDAVRDPTQAAYRVGLVPDQYDFYPNLTGRQHLDFYGRLLSMESESRQARIAEVLALVRMEERADSRVKEYSHGMKQRICIAQAILHKPQLIFFDEPTNGLDPQGAHELREMIKGLAHDGTTIFLNSHQLNEVEQTCGRVAILDRGVLKAVAPMRELQARAAPGGVVLRLKAPTKTLLASVKKKTGIELRPEGGGLFAAVPESGVPDLVAAVVGAGGRVLSVQPSTASLEDVFLSLTGGDSR